MRNRLLHLLLLSLAIASWPISDAAEEIAPAELAVLLSVFAVVLAVQCAAVLLASRWANERVGAVLVAALVAANAYHFTFLTLEAKTAVRALLSAGTGFGAWALMRSGWPGAPFHIFAAAFAAMSFANYGWGRVSLVEGSAKLSKASPVLTVKSTRNVYLISTESLPSPYALRRLHAVADPPHQAYLTSQGFRVLDRSYSVDTTTRVTFQRIMEFADPLPSPRDLRRVFKSGNSTFSGFQAGGYAIQFIYISNYMNLNHALVNHAYPSVGFYICDNLEEEFYYVACRSWLRSFVNQSLFGVRGHVKVGEQIAHLKARIAVTAEDTRPWLTISHIAYPDHTGKTHRFDDAAAVSAFRSKVRGFMPRIADHYRQIVDTIKANDPGAVIVTFGDHGMWLTRGMKAAATNAHFSAEDYVEDRYGALVAVYPADFCTNRIREGTSIALLAKSIISCLNGDDAPTADDEARSRTIIVDDKPVSLEAFGIAR